MVLSISSVVILVLLAIVGFFLAKVWFQKDTEAENRRREAAKLAAVLTNYGLVKTPAFLIDYSVGDYSGMIHKIADMARLFGEGEEAVVKEFDKVYERILDAKLKTEAGRTLIAVKLADARQGSDPSAVQNITIQPAVVQPQQVYQPQQYQQVTQ
jgi:hypothetical protein